MSQKRIPDVIDYTSKHNKQILIIFGTHIPDTNGHQTTIQVPTSPNVCFCSTWGKRSTQNRHWHEQKMSKNIPDVVDCSLKKDDQILIVFGASIPDRTGHQMIVQVPTTLKVCFCTPCRKQNKRNVCSNEQKTSINFISWSVAPTALISVRSITMLAVSCSSESIRCCLRMSMNSRSDWLKSGAEHYRHCYQWMEKATVCLCSHKGLIFWTNCQPKWQKSRQNMLYVCYSN